jgi:hypothetical protein
VRLLAAVYPEVARLVAGCPEVRLLVVLRLEVEQAERLEAVAGVAEVAEVGLVADQAIW